MTPQQYCQEKAAASGSSFYYAFMFLPEKKREAIIALYAFCREVDDIADECTDLGVAQTKLAWWRKEIQDAFAGNPHHPVAQALVPVVAQFGFKKEQFFEIINGMEMDLQLVRYPDFSTLELYCYRVAGIVGEMSATIFGYSQPSTLQYARDLGTAFQLTNIIRDVGEDARRNRIYLPMDELKQFDVPASDILDSNQTPAFQKLMEFQAERARHYYQAAFAELAPADRKTQKPGLIMAAIYQALLHEIEADGFLVLKQKTSLTPIRKLWIAWKTWMRG